MKNIKLLFVSLLIVFIGIIGGSVEGAKQISMTIVYDNSLFKEGTQSDLGFSCFIEGTEKTILFDTGDQGQRLLQNIDTLEIDLDSLDLIVISHNHYDHTGGLDLVLGRKSDVSVYFGTSFDRSFSFNITNKGAIPIQVDESIEICEDVFSTGEMEGYVLGPGGMEFQVNEQSLILDTENGLVIITGCAHPGIISILERAQEILDKNIYLVFGGFHLLNESEATINQIIQEFKTLGVKKCGPAHCTGDSAIALFEEAYGEDYIPMGVGQVIQVSTNTVQVRELYDGQSHIPNGFKLDQNYPNPFNPITALKYDLPERADVALTIYDILGRQIITLIQGVEEPGYKSVIWDGTDAFGKSVGTGIYLYRVKAGDFTQTRKMLLLR